MLENFVLQYTGIELWLAPVISGVSSFLITYVIAVVKIRKDLELKYDIKLNENRLEYYKKLWNVLHYIKEKRHNEEKVTSKDLEDFLAKLRQWYHDDNGGMWLSGLTIQNGYIPVKLEAKKQAKKNMTFTNPDKELDELFRKLSDFRTLLTIDLGSRRDSILGKKSDWKKSEF